AVRGLLHLVRRLRAHRPAAPARTRAPGAGLRGRAPHRRLRQRPVRPRRPLLLRRAQPAVGAAAQRLLQPAREARAWRSDGAGLGAAAAAASRRPARRRPARPAGGAASRTAALRRGPRGRRGGRGGHPGDRAGGRAVTSEDPASTLSGGPASTVLMPLWHRDRPDRLELALRTATLEQQHRPDLLILTVDGTLPAELEAVVDRVEGGEFGPSLVLRHDAHRGVAAALQDGLVSSPHDLVARADADDICR